ncbi:aintegumenta-like protein, putative [Medicago truncatula]|uniref:Aintegumenta-like protein, putative n=1 Tax=Medicago truncatula TaxID=3880 RepID=G7JWC9_MEDTR|nr:aintegumenta-like protein, putative [Medicago truncatula]
MRFHRPTFLGSTKQNHSKLEISSIPKVESISRVSKEINYHQQSFASIPYGILYDSNTAYYHHNLFQHFHANTNDGATESAETGGLNVMPPTSSVEFFLWPNQSY